MLISTWAGWMKLTILSAIFMNVFIDPWGLGDGDHLGRGLLGPGPGGQTAVYLYDPAVTAIRWLADFVRPIQSGYVNLYLLYVFVAVLVAYAVAQQ